MTRNRTSVALAAVCALVVGGLAVVPAAHAVSTPTNVPRGDIAAPASAVHHEITRSAIWASLGGGANLSGAKIRILDSNTGRVAITGKTGDGGVLWVDIKSLPENFTIEASGGKTLSAAKAGLLRADYSKSWAKKQVIFISPVTEVAHQVAAINGTSYAAGMRAARKSFGVPSWASLGQVTGASNAFDGKAFVSWAMARGGVKRALNVSAHRAAKGQQITSFTPAVPTLSTRAKKLRSEASTAVWAGETLMSGVTEGVAAQGTEFAIGDLLSVPEGSGTDAELAEISSELQTALNDLTALQTSVTSLTQTVLQGQYATLAGNISGATTANTDYWPTYYALSQDDPTSPEWSADAASFAGLVATYVHPYVDQYANLFTTNGTTGVLAALFAEYNSGDYTWIDSGDINDVNTVINYWGTELAETAAMENEYLWSTVLPASVCDSGNTLEDKGQYCQAAVADTVSTQTANAQTQSNKVYAQIPTQITNSDGSLDSTIIINPVAESAGGQVAYKVFPATLQEVVQNNSRGNSENPSCDSKGTIMAASSASWPVIQPADTDWTTLWQNKLSDQTWTAQATSTFTYLQKSRVYNGATQYTYQTLQSGAPSAWALVGTDTRPLGGFQNITQSDGYQSVTYDQFVNFLWCYTSPVSLVVSSATDWVYNFATDTSGHDTPTGVTAKDGVPAPIGIIATKPFTFAYID